MAGSRFRELDCIFYPKSIAVVGVSPDKQTVGNSYAAGLLAAGFAGNIYPVNPKGGEFQGLKIYPSLAAIPYPVDYVIVSIPKQSVLQLLDECIVKRVKAVQFFTAGFREEDAISGYKLEQEMLGKARQGGFRIIGPNCVGIYSPEARIPLGPLAILGSAGKVGFLCQSGGIAEKVAELGISRGINYSKGVSLGNGVDLDGSDFLEYLTADSKTQVIGAYLEGIKDGHHFFHVLKDATTVKPVIVLKGGRTNVSAKAALSHTGSLTTRAAIWTTLLKQAGAIEVYSVEELTDSLLLFQQLEGYAGGNRVAFISGLAGGGGGVCVSATDACIEFGLHVPLLSAKTQQELKATCGSVGTILHNPVDIGPRGWSEPQILRKVLEIIAADPVIDLIMVHEDIYRFRKIGVPWEMVKKFNEVIIEIKQNKSIVIVLPHGVTDEARKEIDQMLCRAKIAVFPTSERAAKAIFNLSQYFPYHKSQDFNY